MNVYLDDYGYAMYVEGVESETNYAVVIGVGNVNAYGNATGGATLLLPDGTKKEVRYKMADGSAALTSVTGSITNNTTDEPTGDLVTYTVDSDDTYKLTVVKSRAINGAAGTSAATGSYSESFTNVTGQTSSKANFVFENGKSAIISNAQAAAASQYYNYATSETIFFVANLKSGGKVDNYSVYTGFANMPSTDAVKGIKGISYVTNSKYTTQIDAIYMVVESLGGISDVQTYLVKEKGASVMTEKINGVQVSYYELPAIIDGEVTTARIDADLFDGSRIANATNANSEGVYALKNINKDAKTGKEYKDLLYQIRPAFGGNIIATIVNPDHRPQMATVREGVMRKEYAAQPGAGEVKAIDWKKMVTDADLAVKIIDRQIEERKIDIKGAGIIVAGGYGMGSKENFRLVHELADVLGGEVGASRAAVDAGFTEHARQVGQTGVTVRPKLYIACGISGQIQHTAGMDQSSMVISINSDPEAPINKIADYAITGDVNEIIPKMIKYYKQNSK